MTMPAPCPSSDSTIPSRVAAIEHTYPLWAIKQHPTGTWSATRTSPPTPDQAAAGLRWYVRRPTLDALAAAIAEQFVIAQTAG